MLLDFRCANPSCGHQFEDLVARGSPNPECPHCGCSTSALFPTPADYMPIGTRRMERIASRYTGMKDYLP